MLNPQFFQGKIFTLRRKKSYFLIPKGNNIIFDQQCCSSHALWHVLLQSPELLHPWIVHRRLHPSLQLAGRSWSLEQHCKLYLDHCTRKNSLCVSCAFTLLLGNSFFMQCPFNSNQYTLIYLLQVFTQYWKCIQLFTYSTFKSVPKVHISPTRANLDSCQ